MVKKVKYPIEAFALAMVLFSTGMKEAVLVGISMIFSDVLLCVVHEKSKENNANLLAGICSFITVVAMSLMFTFTGEKLDGRQTICFILVAVLLFKHLKDNFEIKEFDFDDILFTDSIVYASFIVLGLIREYCSTGKIFSLTLPKCWFVTSGLAHPMFALVIVGAIVAALNTYFKNETNDKAPLWVCLPIIILEVPIVIQNSLESDGKIFGIVITTILYLTYRKKIKDFRLPKWMQGIPAEMILLGIIYAVLSLL